MKQFVTIGQQDYSVLVFIPDSASTVGKGKTGLVAADLTCSYSRVETDNDVTVTDVTGSLSDLANLTAAHADWGLKEVSATLAAGLYRLDIADDVFLTGAWSAVVYVCVTTGLAAASPMEFILTPFNQFSATRGTAGTALPAAASNAAGGLPISVAGALDLDTQIKTNIDAILEDTGTTLPSQISGIGSGTGAALNFGPTTDSGTTDPLNGVTAKGTRGTNTYTAVNFDNGVYEIITNAGNNIDWVYKYSVGSGRVASKVTFAGYLAATAPATGKSINVYAYDFVAGGSTWDLIGSITGQAGTTDIVRDFTLLSRNTGTGADAGVVYIRFTATAQAGAVLNVDQLTCSAQNLGQTVGYADGAIWIGGTNANTTPYVDGTADNPVTYAAAMTLSASLGLTRFRVRNGTTVTLNASAANKSFVGNEWTLALGNQAIGGAYFFGCEVSGTGTNTTQATFEHCHINNDTMTGPVVMFRCGMDCASGTPFVAGSAGEFMFVDCYSEVASGGATTPYFSFPGACAVMFRRYSGGANITLNNTGAALTYEVIGGGALTVELGGADLEVRGMPRSVTVTGITSASTVRIDAVTGPISLAGADGAAFIYGVCGTVTDSRTGSPTLTNEAIQDGGAGGGGGGIVQYNHALSEPVSCIAEGSLTISSTAVKLPAAIFDKAKGGILDVLLGVDEADIYLALSGADATSASMKYSDGAKLLISGMADCKRLSMIRVSTDATVRYQAFTKAM